jgi:hypothetical protein
VQLIVHSQEQLVLAASDLVSVAKSNLSTFVTEYEEAQKKRRKKKLRVARTEKDEEELLFDAQKEEFQGKVDAAENYLETRKSELETAKALARAFESMYSPGSQLLDKARSSLQSFFIQLKSEMGDGTTAFPALLENPSIKESYDSILRSYNYAVNYLRVKKDRVVLVEALKEQADLVLLFGDVKETRKLLNDLVDGLFNTIDACVEWPKVCQSALSSLENELVGCILPVIVALGKLSKFCASSDWDAKSGYCRMAAELVKIPFSESVGHPSVAMIHSRRVEQGD